MDNLPNTSSIKKIFNPRIIFLILGVVLLVEGFFVVKSLRQGTPPPPQRISPVGDGKIILVSRKNAYKVGEAIPVAVRVSTGGHSIEGVDVVAKYDPQVLEATSGAVIRGRIFGEYPSIQADQSSGTMRISGITSTRQKGFNGAGLFAFVYFKAKAPGQSSINLDFKPGQTADSNMVDSRTSKDILGSAVNLNVTVR